MKTLEDFLEENKSVGLYDDKTAKDFYMSIKLHNTSVAFILLLDAFSKIGLYDLNKKLDILPSFLNNLPVKTVNELLDSRLDDYVIELHIVPGCINNYGSYLLSDIIVIADDNTIKLQPYLPLLTDMAFYAGSNKKIFKETILSDLSSNKNTYTLDFIARLIIYNEFFKRIDDSEISIFKHTIDSMLQDRKDYLVLRYNYLKLHLYQDTKLISRFNFLKDRTVDEYKKLIDFYKERRTMSKVMNLLDLF